MRSKKIRDEGLRKALAVAGRAVRLASELGITAQAINKWERIPVDRVPDVERITGLPRHVLRPDRPDLFPHPDQERAIHAA